MRGRLGSRRALRHWRHGRRGSIGRCSLHEGDTVDLLGRGRRSRRGRLECAWNAHGLRRLDGVMHPAGVHWRGRRGRRGAIGCLGLGRRRVLGLDRVKPSVQGSGHKRGRLVWGRSPEVVGSRSCGPRRPKAGLLERRVELRRASPAPAAAGRRRCRARPALSGLGLQCLAGLAPGRSCRSLGGSLVGLAACVDRPRRTASPGRSIAASRRRSAAASAGPSGTTSGA